MKAKNEIEIPEGLNISIESNSITISGPKGKVTKMLPSTVKLEGRKIMISSDSTERMNTTLALIKSAMKGVQEGYSKKMKIVFAHFPITIEVKGKEIYIKNFLGEKVPRVASIVGDTTVKPEKEFITLIGPDAYALGQTIANIKTATKIRQKDPRVFQDGLYEISE
ncbi:MAG: 50S ribosomal protein L6 [Candidatus Micrarchaeia archaeon]